MERLQAYARFEAGHRKLPAAASALGVIVLCLCLSPADAADTDSLESLEDAWWTGPILASSAASAPQGHFMIEPYFYDNIVSGQFDANGAHHSTSRTHSMRAGSFVLYGLSERLSVGLIPSFGLNRAGDGARSSLGLGDLSLQAQYCLTEFESDRPFPATSILLSATVPTGRYDRLGSHPEDGLGSGVYTEAVSVYSQYYFWLPTGRVLRTRFDVTFSTSDRVGIRDASVYGTPSNFRGRAAPGDSFVAFLSGEYSVTRNWVAVLEAAFQHSDTTLITGDTFTTPGHAIEAREYAVSSGSSRSSALAAEIEYSWNEHIGVVAGAIFTVSGRNVAATTTPAVAININL